MQLIVNIYDKFIMTGVTRLYERNQIRNQIKLEVEIKKQPTYILKFQSISLLKKNMLNPLRLHVWIHAY